jgi:Cdc6-like AAA superfamily ATPase
MSCVAKRLAEYLANDLTSIRTAGVVGDFGAGKTSIVKWLKHDLALRNASHSTKVITCEVSCWGFEDSALASEYILKEAVKIVGEHVDCFWFRSLPEAYRKSFSAGGDWMRNVSDILIGSADAYEQFERLSQMLECLSMRLVIIVEDLDRLQSSRFEQQEIQALLFRLRRYPSLSFVITGGISVRSGIDYNRLCDRIEYLPALPHEECLDIIVLYRELMLDDYPNNLYPTVTSDNPWMAQRM